MKVGLVGFAGSGKTTVFNTLTGLAVPTGFGGEVHLGTVKVPDRRIDELSRIFKPKKTTYAEIIFSDIPGEHGAEKTGLSRKGLVKIREQDVLCLVLRAFPNPALESAPDPTGELEAFLSECVLADLEMVERRLDRALKEKLPPLEVEAFKLMKQTLEAELPLRSLPESVLHRDFLKGFAMLTDRPLLVVLNRAEGQAAEPLPPAMAQRLPQQHAEGLVLSASVEAEIARWTRRTSRRSSTTSAWWSRRASGSCVPRTTCSISSRSSRSVTTKSGPGRSTAARTRRRRPGRSIRISSAASSAPR